MSKFTFLLTFWLLAFSFPGNCQVAIKGQAGISYIEHFSLGTSINFAKDQHLSAHFGSNFFKRRSEFSSLLLQYDIQYPELTFGRLVPRIGIKAGKSVYTNEYYKWKVINLIPFLGISRPVTNKLELFLESGAAISFEYAVKRISYGEIGHYKKVLPEIKAGVSYTIFQK